LRYGFGQLQAFTGQPELPPAAINQPHIHMGFKRLDLLTDGGMADIQFRPGGHC